MSVFEINKKKIHDFTEQFKIKRFKLKEFNTGILTLQ